MIPYVLLQVVMVPILTSVLVYFASSRLGVKSGWIAFAALLYTTLLVFLVAVDGGIEEAYSWIPFANLTFGLKADGLSIPFVLTVCILSLVISIYSMPYMKHRIGHKNTEYGVYFALYLLYAAGMAGTCLATNLIEFYLFYELMLIPSYFLIAEWGYGEREKIAFMYFIWTHVGALLLLAGILSTYTLSGSFEISLIPGILSSMGASFDLLRWICIAMFIGFFVKMAAFGLHIWLPHAHAEAPTPISALLSPAMIGIGGYATVRITMSFFPEVFSSLQLALSIWALITIIYGSAMALAQDDIKRLLAYSSISQMGYILFGISSYSAFGVTGSMFHYVSHGTCKGILFMAAGAVILQTHGLRSIRKMGGLAAKMPITAMTALIGFLGIMGTPPLNGFQSEWMLFSGVFTNALETGVLSDMVIATLGIIATALTAGYGLWTIRRVFFGQRPQELDDVEEASPMITIPLLILAVLTVITGIYPKIVTDFLYPAITGILS